MRVLRRMACLSLAVVLWVCASGFDFPEYDNYMNVSINNGSNIILVGDSRTVNGSHDTGDTRVDWLACAGTKYDVFEQVYMPMLDASDLNGKTIVILYGINDLMQDGVDSALLHWSNFYNRQAQGWIRRGATIKTATVPGIDYGICFFYPSLITEEAVDEFNEKVDRYNSELRAALPDNVELIPVHTFTENPYVDGLHYSKQDSILIYTSIIDRLAPKSSVKNGSSSRRTQSSSRKNTSSRRTQSSSRKQSSSRRSSSSRKTQSSSRKGQ